MNRINFNLFKSNKIVLEAVKKTPFLSQFYKNNNVLITGGGTGLGKKMAEVYSSMGANVTIASRKEEVLKKSCDDIFKISRNEVHYKVLNLKDHDSVTKLVNEIDTIPDIVINNAAGNFICRSEDLSYNGWNSIIDIVLKGTIDMTLQMGKKMINNRIPSIIR